MLNSCIVYFWTCCASSRWHVGRDSAIGLVLRLGLVYERPCFRVRMHHLVKALHDDGPQPIQPQIVDSPRRSRVVKPDWSRVPEMS